MQELEFEGKKYLSAKAAAKVVGYAQDYVGQLARGGKLEARKVGRVWYVSEESVKAHKENALAIQRELGKNHVRMAAAVASETPTEDTTPEENVPVEVPSEEGEPVGDTTVFKYNSSDFESQKPSPFESGPEENKEPKKEPERVPFLSSISHMFSHAPKAEDSTPDSEPGPEDPDNSPDEGGQPVRPIPSPLNLEPDYGRVLENARFLRDRYESHAKQKAEQKIAFKKSEEKVHIPLSYERDDRPLNIVPQKKRILEADEKPVSISIKRDEKPVHLEVEGDIEDEKEVEVPIHIEEALSIADQPLDDEKLFKKSRRRRSLMPAFELAVLVLTAIAVFSLPLLAVETHTYSRANGSETPELVSTSISLKTMSAPAELWRLWKQGAETLAASVIGAWE